MSYIDQYSKEELSNIIKNSYSYKEVARKIGYSNTPSGDTLKKIKEKISEFDTSHFNIKKNNFNQQARTPEETFIINSPVSQKVMRELYKKGNYSKYKCSICGLEPFWNNQELTLILDHINGINNDDRLENLRWVCPNCNQQLPTTGSRNPNRNNFAKKYYCIDCGKEIFRGATRCRDCDNKHRTIPLEDMPVTREELKNMIRTMPFTKIGEKFGIRDNSIRKWCIKFNLPTKKTDINKYSDEEWENI